jgi:hypothetical protein
MIAGKQRFHDEKDEILRVGLEVSRQIHVDDTGARHQGKNGYRTHIGNEMFAWFASATSKSRINFLELLRAGNKDYVITDESREYMAAQKLPQAILHRLENLARTRFEDLCAMGRRLARMANYRRAAPAHHHRGGVDRQRARARVQQGVGDHQ